MRKKESRQDRGAQTNNWMTEMGMNFSNYSCGCVLLVCVALGINHFYFHSPSAQAINSLLARPCALLYFPLKIPRLVLWRSE